MITNTHNLFSIPIQETIIIGDELVEVQNELTTCYNKLSFEKNDNWNPGEQALSSNAFKDSVIDRYDLRALKGIIEKQVRLYTPSCHYDVDFRIKQSWFTRFDRGEYAHKHNHGSCDLSGCYYMQTNGGDGNIRFFNPTQCVNDFNLSELCFEYVSYPPSVGKLLLFPSWLEHDVTENTTDSIRVSIAFNISFKRY